MWSAIITTYLMLVAGVAVTVTRYGIWDLTPYLPLREIGIEPPPQESIAPSEIQPDLVKPNPALVFGKAIEDGASALRAKDFSRAALEYNRALSVKPDSREALGGLAKAYEGLGDREQARRLLSLARGNENH